MNINKIEEYFKDKPGLFQRIKQDCTDILFPVDNPIESEDEDEPKNVGEFFRRYPGTEDEHFAVQRQFEAINNDMSDDDINEIEYEYHTTLIPVIELVNNDGNQELERILKLSEETHRMEKKYKQELNAVIKKSMEHHNNLNDISSRYQNNITFNNNYQNRINNIRMEQEQIDKELEEVLYKIAIEESQFNELNEQWGSEQIYGNYYRAENNFNVDNKVYIDDEFIDNEYYNEDNISYINNHQTNNHKLGFHISESKPIKKEIKKHKNKKTKKNTINDTSMIYNSSDNNINTEIQYLIKKRKSFGKSIPKIKRDNSFDKLYRVQIVGY
jgi:hypothetical protein